MAKEEIGELVVAKRNWKLIIVIVIIVIIALVPSIYFYTKYLGVVNNSAGVSKEQAQALVDSVSKLIELPKNEQPTIATVSDKSKLADQPFFANAENGDKVLIYSQARKAILYRPSENKIIEVAPVNLGTNSLQVTSQATPAPTSSISTSSSTSPTPIIKSKTVSLLILNGTKTAGLAGTAKQRITAKLTNISTTSTGNSVNDYAKTVIVDPSANKQVDDQLVGIVGGGIVSAMPSGEKASSADITIILGADFK